MKQIGGEQSALFSLTAAEFRRLQERVRDDRSFEPHAIFPEGPNGALVRFRSSDDAVLAKLAIV
jgi:hypothetical protein